MNVICDQCGASLKRIPAKVNIHNFCDRKCHGLWRKGKSFVSDEGREALRRAATGKIPAHLFALGQSQRGEKNPRWKGDGVSVDGAYKRADTLFPVEPCEVCGAGPTTTIIHRHHKDENPRHNTRDNIAFLCPKHHRDAHGGTWRQKRNREKSCQFAG